MNNGLHRRFVRGVWMKIPVLAALCVLAFEALNCKDTGTTPPPPGRDTTSQNFTITTWEYGDGYSSAYANDAWIFDQNNIWVVGEFPDTGSAPSYNIMRWNGTAWKGYTDFYRSNGISSLWALDSGTVYLTTVALYKYKNGAIAWCDMSDVTFQTGQTIEHVWASSESNVWGVGANGCIVHFDGTKWSKHDVNAQWMFSSICGSFKTGIAYASAVNATTQETAIYSLSLGKIDTIFHGGNFGNPVSIYDMVLRTESELWTAGTSIRRYDLDTRTLETLSQQPRNGYCMSTITMAGPNDMYFWGDDFSNQLMTHYNGARFTTVVLPSRGYVMHRGGYATAQEAILAAFSDNKAYLVFARRGAQ